MKAEPRSPTSHRRDYDRRKKRGPMRKPGRPLWRQPVMLGLVVHPAAAVANIQSTMVTQAQFENLKNTVNV